MRRAALLLPFLALGLGTHGPQAAAAAPAPPRALVVLLPGAGEPLVERMLADGVMPHLARLKHDGLAAPLKPGVAAGTVSGRSTLWTGAWSAVHGVTGDRLLYPPGEGHTLLETSPSAAPEALQAEPLHQAAARAGKPTLALHVTHAAVPAESAALAVLRAEPGGEDGVWTEAQGLAPAAGWSALPASDRAPLETTYSLAGTTVRGLVFGDPADPAPGYDTVWLTAGRSAAAPVARLKAGAPMERNAWSAPVSLGEHHAFFRLFALGRDGRSLMLYHTAPQRWATNRPAWLETFSREGWGYVEGPASEAFTAGQLGPTLAEGGDGSAEARYLDTVRFCLFRRQQVARHLLGQAPWTLAVNEVPLPGPAIGMWLGYLTPRSPGHSPELAEHLWPALRQVFVEVDAYLGALRQALPPEATMVVASDTGYAPTRWDFMPNVALRRAGLLAVDAEGNVDLARTKALFPDTGGQYLAVNVVGRPGGTVPPEEVATIVKQARAALSELKVKTPGGMVSLVPAMWEPTAEAKQKLGLGGSRGGELYLALQPGYALSSAVTGDVQFADRPPNRSAAPATLVDRPEARGLLVMAGPAVRRGAVIKGGRAIDVAPTVARLIGAPAPAHAQGRVLKQALRP